MFSEFSNPAQTALLDVSDPAENLRARTTPRGIELEWDPPSASSGGRKPAVPAGWRVYQNRKGEKDTFEQLGETAARDYLVRDIEYGHPHFFKIRAVFRQGQWVAESEDSPVVEVTPRDTFPPAAPEGLSAIYTAGAVEMIWTANTEPDLGGYNIYRRAEDGRWQKVNSEIQRTPLYRDSTAAPEKRYFYRATALDLADNESDASVEIVVETK